MRAALDERGCRVKPGESTAAAGASADDWASDDGDTARAPRFRERGPDWKCDHLLLSSSTGSTAYSRAAQTANGLRVGMEDSTMTVSTTSPRKPVLPCGTTRASLLTAA